MTTSGAHSVTLTPEDRPETNDLLTVNDLTVDFTTGAGTVRAVDGASFSVPKGVSLGLVGESGCGKSTTAYALMRLLPRNGRIAAGEVRLNGADLVRASEKKLRDTRWRDISMIFQNAMTALNPVLRIGDQLIDALRLHREVSRRDALADAKQMFERVGLPPSRLMQYPHEFSGGMKQRAVIALALICGPSLVLADEPTTALDVVAQRRILELLEELRAELGNSLIMISHDISAVAETCSQVAVMYAGQIVETGPTRATLLQSHHPYTHALVSSFPALGVKADRLPSIDGAPPDLSQPMVGCRFAPRCPFAQEVCRREAPPMVQVAPGRESRCHFATSLELGSKPAPTRADA